MKLCSVCDKKISGSWCKNCHRFVKTYYLPDGIHLNESHNPKNDENCTYHMADPAIWNTPAAPRSTQSTARNTQSTARNTQSTARNAQSAVRSTQTAAQNTRSGSQNTQSTARSTQSGSRNTQTMARNTQSTARSTQTTGTNPQNYGSNTGTQKKKPAKSKGPVVFVVVIIILYAFFILLVRVVPFVMDMIGDLNPETRYEEEQEEDTDQDRTDDWGEDSSLSEAKRELEEIKRVAALQKLQPVDTDKDEEGWQYSFYLPEEIQELEFECNMQSHFELTLSGFTTWLEQNFDEAYEESENLDQYKNYLAEGEGESWYCFSSYHDYLISDYFGIRVDYDTAVETIHGIAVLYTVEEDHAELCYNVLKMLDPETDWSKTDFSEQMEEVLRTEEYMEIYSSDFLNIAAQVGEGVLSIVYYPSYE